MMHPADYPEDPDPSDVSNVASPPWPDADFKVIPPDPIVLPADKDKLARWLGDHAGLLARLQEMVADMRLIEDVTGRPAATISKLVGTLIREAVEHMEEMPR